MLHLLDQRHPVCFLAGNFEFLLEMTPFVALRIPSHVFGLTVSPLEERVHRAAARAQLETGLPLSTHTLYHSTGAAQMALFDEEGVDPGRVCISHCDTFPSLEYAASVARWGGYVSIDNLGHQAGDHEDQVRRVVLGLLDAGFRDQILLSQDVGQVHELRSRGGRGYTYMIEQFLPALRESGVDEDTIHTITVENPRRWLTIARPASTGGS